MEAQIKNFMKKMMIGLFALVLCFGSLRGMGQELKEDINPEVMAAVTNLSNALKPMFKSLNSKVRILENEERQLALNNAKAKFEKMSHEESLNRDDTYLSGVAEEMGYDNLEIFKANFETIIDANTHLNKLVSSNQTQARIATRILASLIANMDDDFGGGGAGSDCKNPKAYFACVALAMATAQGSLWACLGITLCPPCGTACAIAVFIGQQAAIYLCYDNYCLPK